jgi:hypothetical protein
MVTRYDMDDGAGSFERPQLSLGRGAQSRAPEPGERSLTGIGAEPARSSSMFRLKPCSSGLRSSAVRRHLRGFARVFSLQIGGSTGR